MDDLLQVFPTETNESIAALDVEPVNLEQNPDHPELIDNIFRLVHTIKGTCGFLDLWRPEAVAHTGAKAARVCGSTPVPRQALLLWCPGQVTAVLRIATIQRVGMKTCLIVDDSKVIRMVARRILEELEFEIEEAVDGQDALDCCNRNMPDAVLLDWNMPVMNGIDFLRQLRRSSEGQDAIVVFCTTENDMAHIREAIEAGANEYIMKPFDKEIIEAKFLQVGLL